MEKRLDGLGLAEFAQLSVDVFGRGDWLIIVNGVREDIFELLHPLFDANDEVSGRVRRIIDACLYDVANQLEIKRQNSPLSE